MSRFLLRRLSGGLTTVIGASIIAFLVMRLVPGDPARLVAGEYASDEAVQYQAAAMGLDQPVPVQYWRYMRGFVTGDWGFSYAVGEPVIDQFARRLPATLELAVLAVVVAVMCAIVAAAMAAHRQRSFVDTLVRYSSYSGLGVAPFWLGILLLMLFSQALGWLPGPEGRLAPGLAALDPRTGAHTVDALLAGRVDVLVDALRHLALPAATLGYVLYAYLVRILRASMLETGRETFVTVARSKGRTRWQALVRHVLPNSLIPSLTVVGLLFAQLLTVTLLVETVFNWPGVGSLVATAIIRQDFAVVQAFILVSAVLTVLVTVAVDVLYGVVDPRIRVAAEVELP